MTKQNTLKVKLSNSQLNKLKSGIINDIETSLNFSSNLMGNSIDKTNFPQKSLLTDIQVRRNCKAFANGSSADVKY